MSSSSSRQSWNRTSMVVYAFAAIGGINWGYDTGIIASALLYINEDFNLSPFMSGWIVSSLLIGAMIGSIAAGRMNDRLGRRRVILIAALLATIGPFGVAFAPNTTVLVLSRFVLGLSTGFIAVTVPVYLSEVAPKQIRGAVTGLYALAIVSGQLVAYIVGASLASFEAWRWMVGLAVVPSIPFLLGVFFIWETPRWFVKQHREEEAWQILRYDRDEDTARTELDEIKEMERIEEEEGIDSWRDLLAPWVRPILVVGIGLAVLQQLMGINTIIYYAPTTLTNVGFGDQAAVTANIGIGVLVVLGVGAAMLFADRLGRKPLLLGGAIGSGLSLALLAVTSMVMPEPTGIGPVGIITFACMGLYLVAFGISWGSIVWVMLGEIFPLGIRGAAMGLATLLLWAGNFVVSLSFPVLLAALGVGGVFSIFALICLAAALFTWLLVPETKGRSLEEIEADLRGQREALRKAPTT